MLIYDDQKLAGQMLSGLRADPAITAAAFFDKNGKLFAAYPADLPAFAFPITPGPDGIKFRAAQLTLCKPVIQEQSRVGTLYLRENLDLFQHLQVYGLVLFLILAGSGVVAMFLSNLFQRRITGPLSNLTDVAKTVSSRKDYSVRATKTSGDEVGDLTEAFNSMLDQIQASHSALKLAHEETLAASRAKDDFLAALSHELRTPLNPVLLVASDAANNPQLPAGTRADFEMIRRNVELEARLIDDLLDLTRITRGKLLLDWQLLDAHHVLQEAMATVRMEAEKKEIRLAPVLHAGDHAVYGDSVRLQQVFWNVLKNAVKFTPEGGKITVKTFTQDERLFIQIIDTGIGMNSEELKRAFDAFSQGDHAEGGAHRFGGLGLGLAISRMLVELHSGSIHASSEGRGQGATFLIQLPLARTVKNDGALPSAKSAARILPAASSARTDAEPLRILLVEDHEPTRTALTHLLARRRYEVAAAASLSEARAFAGKQKFDVLISDIGLPDGSGYDLMAELRERYGLKGIALTGYGTEQDVARSQKSGFVAHLTKPVRMESLDSALATFLDDKPDLVP
jgi:signal transduction histidine kinase/CheY-like chemotaxis protein